MAFTALSAGATPPCQLHTQRGAWRAPPSRRRWHQAAPRDRRHRAFRAAASGPDDAPSQQPLSSSSIERAAELGDLNQLQTALNRAIAADDWEAAAKVRDLLRALTGADGQLAADWKALGIQGWLADRAESMGFSFPTGAACAGNRAEMIGSCRLSAT